MNTASLERCRELYELSAWDDTGLVYCQSGSYREGYGPESDKGWFAYDEQVAELHHQNKYPRFVAYDLGYLLRKLQNHRVQIIWTDGWNGSVDLEHDGYATWREFADTPEDAAAKLCISLFQQGIIQREKI